MKVHEIMTGHARSVTAETTLIEVAGLMRQLDVGALPVCDGDTVSGIVTDRDLVVRGLADGRDPRTTRVSEVMSGGVVAVSAEDDVELAARIMEQHQIRRLPVLDRSRRLVGIVSLGDIAISSNPAFGGLALRDVSEPSEPTARQRRLARQSEPMRMPAMGGARRAPAGRSGRTSGSRANSRTRGGARKTEAKKGGSGRRRSAAKAARSAAATRSRKSAKRSRRAAR